MSCPPPRLSTLLGVWPAGRRSAKRKVPPVVSLNQRTKSALTTFGPTADRRYSSDMTLPATRRQQKKNKERERKQRRRQTKRDLAGDKQASGEKETQVADPAAETPRTTQGSSEVLRATPLPKRASEEIADGEARGQSRESAETTVGGVKPKPIKRVAVSVSKPVGQVVMAEAGAEALEAAGVVEMEVTMAVAVAAPSSSATAATVACNNDNKLAVARELQSKEAECVGIKKASTAAEAAETPAEKPAAPATGAIEAAEEAEVKAGVRTRLKQALVKAVTAELRNRAEEEAISKVRRVMCLFLELIALILESVLESIFEKIPSLCT